MPGRGAGHRGTRALRGQALSRTTPLGAKPGRYRPDDELLAFLERL